MNKQRRMVKHNQLIAKIGKKKNEKNAFFEAVLLTKCQSQLSSCFRNSK